MCSFYILKPSNFLRELRALQNTQESITRLSAFCANHPLAAEYFYNCMIKESEEKPQKRLVIFYLFNDLAQASARKHQIAFLEAGASFFIPRFAAFVHKLSFPERKPYLRTVEIWRERHVYSVNYCTKLYKEWSQDAFVESWDAPLELNVHAELVEALESVSDILKLQPRQEIKHPVSSFRQVPEKIEELRKAENAVAQELEFLASALIKLSKLEEIMT